MPEYRDYIVYAASVSNEGNIADFVTVDCSIDGIRQSEHTEIDRTAFFIKKNGSFWSQFHLAEPLSVSINDIVVTVKHTSNDS